MPNIEKVRVIKDGKICNVSFDELAGELFADFLKRMDKVEVVEEK
jgi:hypothetical protein